MVPGREGGLTYWSKRGKHRREVVTGDPHLLSFMRLSILPLSRPPKIGDAASRVATRSNVGMPSRVCCMIGRQD